MKKLLFVFFALLLSLSAFAADFGYVYDDADLFSDDEETLIWNTAEQVYDDSGLLCVVVTDYGIGDVLNNLYSYAGSATDMVMLTIDMSAREFEIYQYNSEAGESAFRISYNESENILDSIFNDIANSYYADAAIMFIKMSQDEYENDDYFVSGDYDGYDYVEYDESFGVQDALMFLVVGAIAGGLSVLFVWLSYKKKVHGATYPLSQYSKLSITDSKDTFVTKNVIVTRIPDPPSSSGGGHGGGFRGGGGGARMGGRSF